MKKAWLELELLVLVMVFSIVVALIVIVDAGIALGMGKYNLTLVAVRAFELVFAVVWLSISIKMTLEINKFRRKYFKPRGRLDEEQKKSEATELVRDLVAFYRGYYRGVMTVLGLAIAVGLAIVVAAFYLLLNGYMSFWEATFRWILSSVMLLMASGFYIHVHGSWGKKLLRIKDAEKRLSEILGGPLEA